MKIGILTLPFEPNYGWAVQMWALYHIIEKLGHQPVIINRRWNSKSSNFIIRVKRWAYYQILCSRFIRFIIKEIPSMTPVVRDSRCTSEVTKDLDLIIVGSDQVWRIENTRGADLDFFLDFLGENPTKRLSYAASFGTDSWKGTFDETEKIKVLLAKFNAISVREKSGVSLCRNIFNVNAQQVLDPTLLLNASDYNSFLSDHRENDELVTYILDSTEEKSELLECISHRFFVKLVQLYPKSRFSYYRSVYMWLEKIRDARFVIVDSFHGMVFSLIFSKQFVVLANSKRGLTRFTSLLESIGLENRLLTSVDSLHIIELLQTPIDYEEVHNKISLLRVDSMEFLKQNLV